jgi:Z1 domain
MAGVANLVEVLVAMVRGGMSPEDATRRLSEFSDPDDVNGALAEFARRTGRVRTLKDPRSLQRPDLIDWYTGPEPGDRFWNGFRGQLENEGWKEPELGGLNDASTKVLSLMQPPGLPKVSTRGIVIGYVQSGKTANFTAVSAKACDVGYKFVIVLGGVIESLRRQTQRRLDRQLIAPTHADWFALTDATRGFTRPPGRASAFLTERHELKIMCVVLKQHRRLRYLIDWLRSAGEEVLRTCPVLILDDEADQASVNAARNPEERTAINRLIVEALQTLPKVAYVGYTATPFANVLVNPLDMADIYPRDFIVDLPKPRLHFGPEDIFGREPIDADEDDVHTDGLDMVREVPAEELSDLQPPGRNAVPDFYPSVTPSLDEALRFFLLATAARRVRGQTDQHSTMLVHTTFYTTTHLRFQPAIQAHLRRLADAFHGGGLIDELRAQWESESTTPGVTAADFDLRVVAFEEILTELPAVFEAVEVIVDNARSLRRLEYGEEPVTCVVIGGNTLSRGLTLEGLVVSFMVRTLSAYDSVLQAGRFFGYRPGYGDLPRLWMTTELEQDFRDLARVEAEIRSDVRRYEMENVTPEDFAVRIPTHPKLAVTAALKMQHAVEAQVSYSGRRLQTIMFAHREREWLDNNLMAGRDLISGLIADGHEPVKLLGRWMFEAVAADRVLGFVEAYDFHQRSFEFRRKSLIRDYVQAQRKEDGAPLERWNVVIVSRRTGAPLGTIELGLPETVPLLNRARMKRSDSSYADIKALMSKVDWIADFRDLPSVEELRQKDDAALAAMRPKGIGLLLLYPVSKESRPTRESKPADEKRTRVRLDAVEHVLGVGLAFPKADKLTPQSYVAVELPGRVEEDPWDPDADEDDDSNVSATAHGG